MTQTKTLPAKQEQPEKGKRNPHDQHESETLVRMYGYDIAGSRPLYVGLTRIKGISWTISNAICLNLKLPHSKKIVELTKAEIAQIEAYLPKLNVPAFMKNRRSDPETGNEAHLFGTDLDMARDFDIKRLKEVKSYRGVRHALKQPVRGQRTRSHFRKKSMAAGMKKKKAGSAS